jgi:hypothetical protein
MRNGRKDIGKYIGEYTARGVLTEEQTEAGTPQRIQLFDGSFDTAFKVVEFHVWSTSSLSNTQADVVGKLSTSRNSTQEPGDFFQAADSNEIAWCASGFGLDGMNAGTFSEFLLDHDNIVIEDLWVYVRSATDTIPVNYMVRMEKYEVGPTIGAVTMAKNKSKDSGSNWNPE